MLVINNLPISGGTKSKLLYENSTETPQQNQFTLDIDLSKYTHVLISCGDNGSTSEAKVYNKSSYQLIPVGDSSTIIWFAGNFTINNFGQINTRNVTTTNSSLTFSTPNGTTGTTPLIYKIYGVVI